MKSWSRRILLFFIALASLLAVWVWWNRPEPVDMSAYVPAESIVFFETNSLPEIVRGLISTDGWKALAPPSGFNENIGQINWLSRLSAWTGIGTAETVVFSRSQVAVAVLGFEATEESETSLDIKPRVALIAETHTNPQRVRTAVMKIINDYARRTYGEPTVTRQEPDDTIFITWSSMDGKKKIVAAIAESVAVIGNDDETIRACLAVQRGERASLANDAQLAQMRLRMGAANALAFGYVSPVGARRLLEVAAIVYGGQLMASNPKIQSAAAILIPQLAGRILGAMAWSSHIAGGAVEDSYYLNLQNDLASRLQTSLATSGVRSAGVGELLPADTAQLTTYNYRAPEAAWRGLNAAISSQLEPTLAPVIGRFLNEFLDESLKPFGIDEPRDFLRTVGPEITTARLDQEGTELVLLASVRDREALTALVRKRLGAGAQSERIGGAEMLIAEEKENGAASFIGGYLIMGGADEVRRCLHERAISRTLNAAEAFRQIASVASANDAANVSTFTNDVEPARRFISFLSNQNSARKSPPNFDALRKALATLPYALSETRLVEGGFEKKTRSSFGQFGALIVQLATDVEAASTR